MISIGVIAMAVTVSMVLGTNVSSIRDQCRIEWLQCIVHCMYTLYGTSGYAALNALNPKRWLNTGN